MKREDITSQAQKKGSEYSNNVASDFHSITFRDLLFGLVLAFGLGLGFGAAICAAILISFH